VVPASSIATTRGAVDGRTQFERIGILDGLAISDGMRVELASASRAPVITVAPGSREAPEVDCLLAGWQHHLDLSLLASFPALRLVLLRATSRDRVDEDALRERGIQLSALGRYGDESTAEFAVSEMLSHFRGDAERKPPRELAGRTLGVVGMGAVGRLVARTGLGLGMLVVYSAGSPDRAPRVAGTRPLSTDELLARADVVTIHTPPYTVVLTPEQLARSNAELLIVTTLGLPVSEHALAAWVENGRHAVLDMVAAQDAAGRLAEKGIDVRRLYAARSAESTVRAERQLLDHLRQALEREPDGS
jgi:phosphoglycerate dehydrogenase-like enzyme